MILRLVLIFLLFPFVSCDEEGDAATCGDLDTTSVVRLIHPEITAKQIKCNYGKLHIIWPNKKIEEAIKWYRGHLECNEKSGKWKTTEKEPKHVEEGSKVFCEELKPDDLPRLDDEKSKDDQKEDNDKTKKEFEEMWNPPVIIATEALLVFIISIPISLLFLKLVIRKEEKKNVIWSEQWDVVKFDPDPWNWKVVLDFIHHWHKRTIEEKVKFLERGYWELGFKSTITQMLYIFEYMLMVENHCLVWRPMLTFLVRMKRLATAPNSEVNLMFKFNSWISLHGQRLMDEYGFLEGDVSDATSDTCSSDPSWSMSTIEESDEEYDEDDLSTESDEDEDAWWDDEEEETEESEDSDDDDEDDEEEEEEGEEGKEKEGSKAAEKVKGKEEAKGKSGKGEEKRGAAGADVVVKNGVEVKKEEGKKEEKKEEKKEVKKEEVKIEEKKLPKSDEMKKEEEKTGGDGTGTEVKEGEGKQEEDSDDSDDDNGKMKDYDPHDVYCRFVGVFLINLGTDGRDKEMIELLRELNESAFYDITGPIIGALGASQLRRDDHLIEFERIWHRMSNYEDLEADKPWGSLWDHSLYALGSVIEDEPFAQISEFVLKNKKVLPRHIVSWFRGANDRGSHVHMPFLVKNWKMLSRKMAVESNEFYECIRMYCQYDHTSVAWDYVERLVARCPVLAKKLNVPEYRRRAQHFTAHYMWRGDVELKCFLKDAERMADIRDAEFVPTGEMAAKEAEMIEIDVKREMRNRKDPKDTPRV